MITSALLLPIPGISSIEDIAASGVCERLGSSPVMPTGVEMAIKSIGNSTTTPKDLNTVDEARCVYYLLAESVGARLRENGFRTKCVSISVRTSDLVCYSCQRTITMPTNITSEIAELACKLFIERYRNYFPLRSVGISCVSLVPDTQPIQLDMLGDFQKRERYEKGAVAQVAP